MSDEIEDLNEMLGFLGDRGRQRRDPEEHPSPEELSAYQANELFPEEDERIQDHLAVCQHCTELLLDLEELLEPPAAAPAADFEAAADWRRLQEEMGQTARKPEPLLVPPSRQQDYRLVKSLQIYRALAAVLGLMIVGLFLYTVRPHDRLEIFPLPISSETIRGGAEEALLKVRLPSSLEFSAPSEYPLYRVEIMDRGEHRRYSLETKLADGQILLKADSLVPGTYELRLSGLKDGVVKSLDSYKFIVQP